MAIHNIDWIAETIEYRYLEALRLSLECKAPNWSAVKKSKDSDPLVMAAFRFLKFGNVGPLPIELRHVRTAFRFRQDDSPTAEKWLVEALALGGADPELITANTGCPTEAVKIYLDLFFDIAERGTKIAIFNRASNSLLCNYTEADVLDKGYKILSASLGADTFARVCIQKTTATQEDREKLADLLARNMELFAFTSSMLLGRPKRCTIPGIIEAVRTAGGGKVERGVGNKGALSTEDLSPVIDAVSDIKKLGGTLISAYSAEQTARENILPVEVAVRGFSTTKHKEA